MTYYIADMIARTTIKSSLSEKRFIPILIIIEHLLLLLSSSSSSSP
jgi:hypothetical protein